MGVRTSYIFFPNISWTSSSGPHYKSLFEAPPWLHSVTIGVPEGEEQEQEVENLFEQIMKENFPNLSKEVDFQEDFQ